MSQADSAGGKRSARHPPRLAEESPTADPHVAPHLAAALLERVSDGFVALDKDWRYAYVNEQAAALFGRRPADLLGRHIWTEFPEGVGQPFHHAYERAMAEQVFVQLEAFYAPWDRWFENRIYPSPDGIAIFFHEITDRKLAERQAREAGDLLQAQNRVLECIARGAPLEETLDVLLRAIEAQTPDTLASILLLEPDGLHVRHAAAPSLPEGYVRAIDGEPIGPKAGSCGTAAYLGKSVIVSDIASDPLWDDYRGVALGHGLRACWSTPIVDGRQRVLGTFAMYFRQPGAPTERDQKTIDVTTYTAAIAIVADRDRQEARGREVQFEEAQRLAQIGSYAWNSRSNMVRRSKELCRIFGIPPDEFAPTFEAYLARVHPDDRSRTQHAIEQSVRDRTPFEFEERIVRPDGTVRALRSQGRWIGEDAAATLVGICQDITDRKHTDEQLRRSDALRIRNEELKAFAYMVSHDLKAPLRGIAGYARELSVDSRDALNPRGRRCVDEILAGARSLDRLVEDLLEYSRVDSLRPVETDVDLCEVVGTILRDRRAQIDALRADVMVQLAVSGVRGWDRGIRQVLTNLIDNALKYSRDATPPTVRIVSAAHSNAVRVTVGDNGVGFDMSQHDRIFGLFTRLPGHDHFEGTGAGLAIVQKIAGKMGARVWAESTPGAGARFHLELPEAGRDRT
jgi:PAS domain S-box-containing protein